MKITSKGQVTIPQSVREQAGLHPHSEVEFEVRANGEGAERRDWYRTRADDYDPQLHQRSKDP